MLALSQKQDSDYWHLFRSLSRCITSTQVAAIFYDSPYLSKQALFRLVHQGIKKSEYKSAVMEEGQKNEMSAIVECGKYLTASGIFPENVVFRRAGTFIHPREPITCTPDAFVLYDGRFRGIEVKNVSSSCPPVDPRDIITQYLLQCFVSIYVTRAEDWFLFIRNVQMGEWSLFCVERENDLWEKEILPEILRFLREETVVTPHRKSRNDSVKLLSVRNLLLRRVRLISRGHPPL